MFWFGKMNARLYDIRRNKKRQDQGQGRAGQRAIQYEERIRNATGINILKECLKEKERQPKQRTFKRDGNT